MFHLFGYFGNVARMKVVESRGLVIIDYATPEECQNAMRFIRDDLVLFGARLHTTYAKYPNLQVRVFSLSCFFLFFIPLQVPPGTFTDVMRDYTQYPRMHRYAQGISSERVRWIVAPTVRLHVIIAGTPPPAAQEEFRKIFDKIGEVKAFKINGAKEGSKLTMGIIEFASPEMSTDALAIMHNYEFDGGKLFLSFTTKPF
jgi:hypothetical protein